MTQDKAAKVPTLAESVLSRFEEGQPADPTENMSPEDAKRWREEHAKNRDRFTKEAASRSTAKSWMAKNVKDYVDGKTGEVNATGLAEAAADEFDAKDVGGWLDDETHWVWDIAAEVAEHHERTHKNAAEVPLAIRVAGRFVTADQDKSAPSKVDDYFKEVKESNPSYSDEQAWATAWSIYCKNVNPNSPSCHQDEYLTGKSAARKPKTTVERQQLKVLQDTVRTPGALANVMGGPSVAEAEAALRTHFNYTDAEIRHLKQEATQTMQRVERHELQEMAALLKRHGYDPDDAERLHDEEMGSSELEHILKTTRPGEMGSLEYTRGLRKIKTAASLSDLNDSLYNTRVKLKGYNGQVTVSTAHGADKGKVLIQLAPQMSKGAHSAKAREFAALAEKLDEEWSREADEAAMETWGRPFQVTDYRISGIGSDEFSPARKNKLRTFAHGGTKAKDIAEAHTAAAKSRMLTAGFSYAMGPLSVLFVDGKKPVPFNVDTIQEINHATIEIIGDDGEKHDVNLKFVRQESSGPLTHVQEKQGWKREVKVDIEHPVDEGSSTQASARAALSALVDVGKKHGFKVEPVSRNYQPQTRKKASVETAADEAMDALKDDADEWLAGQKRGEWNLTISKYSPSRWSYFLKNPRGGGGGTTGYRNVQSAITAAINGVAWGEPQVNPGKDRIWIMEQVWNAEEGAYETKKSYWWKIPEDVRGKMFKQPTRMELDALRAQ